MSDTPLRIVFFGTPEFAVGTLHELIENKMNVVGVVTAPDRPAGRGLQLRQSDVKVYAEQHNLPLLQPIKLRDEKFISELQNLNADLFIVVAFRMLPEVVWKMPSKGTFNLHASLLPNYRGAAPINWAIMNGETKTGVTTFFINEAIDTGNIIAQAEVDIDPNDSASTLHDKLKHTGAELVVKTVIDIAEENISSTNQNDLLADVGTIKNAPKLFKEDRLVNWQQSAEQIYNQIRGLSLFPCAYFKLGVSGKKKEVKVYEADFEKDHNAKSKEFLCDSKSFMKIGCTDGYILIKNLQMEGKKRMSIEEFLRGFNTGQQIEILE
ncbi:MAG: methionyl-tRNA formyltransferase [Bacteroidia bacterium]|nr:methionyl-tRNA formyltransferase [Bacteroidia bacterium]